MTRLFEVSSILSGKSALQMRRMLAKEELGRPFWVEVDLVSEDHEIDLESMLGTKLGIRCVVPGGRERFFHGLVAEFRQLGSSARYARYRAVLRPWFWFLTRTANCRIFQGMDVVQIAKKVCAGHGFSEIDAGGLVGDKRKLDYCVQYRETDANFISRLFEQEGIYYFFKHEQGKHTLVLANDPGSHDAAPGYQQIPFRITDSGQDAIYEWESARSARAGKYVLSDFDFENSTSILDSPAANANKHEHGALEMFDYPGEFVAPADGEKYAGIRLEEAQCRGHVASGRGDTHGVHVGSRFALVDHPRADQNREYLVVDATHAIDAGEEESANRSGAGEWSSSFGVTPADHAYRPARTTPKPVVQGPQTAIVVGRPGEEVSTDEYGRVKVQFHWDRARPSNEQSSCWVRVAQVWAGKEWGGMFIPRIGQEVLVEFLEGDPDRPIVTGRVYNDVCKPPYKPDDRPTVSTIKSNSSPGGGGFNELRFEDEAGKEEVFVHAQKDMNVAVLNDRSTEIGHDEQRKVDNDRTTKIAKNDTLDVGETVTADVGKNVTGKIGKNLEFEVGDQIVLKCGMSKFVMKKDGTIQLEGMQVTVKGMTTTVKGTKLALSGDAIAELAGGIIKIG